MLRASSTSGAGDRLRGSCRNLKGAFCPSRASWACLSHVLSNFRWISARRDGLLLCWVSDARCVFILFGVSLRCVSLRVFVSGRILLTDRQRWLAFLFLDKCLFGGTFVVVGAGPDLAWQGHGLRALGVPSQLVVFLRALFP